MVGLERLEPVDLQKMESPEIQAGIRGLVSSGVPEKDDRTI